MHCQNLLPMIKSIQYISNHPLSNSKSKETHTFKKSPRFRQITINKTITEFYDLSQSELLSNRAKAASYAFGRSSRFRDEEKKRSGNMQTPSPQSYRSPYFGQRTSRSPHRTSFTKEEKYPKMRQSIPGPGSYEIAKTKKDSSRFYIIPRYAYSNKAGPTGYDSKKLQKFLGSTSFSKSQRFKDSWQARNSPGPGAYIKCKDMSQQRVSYNKSPQSTFDKSKRTTDIHFIDRNKMEVPGPGAYNSQFSQFSERSRRILEIIKRL